MKITMPSGDTKGEIKPENKIMWSTTVVVAVAGYNQGRSVLICSK